MSDETSIPPYWIPEHVEFDRLPKNLQQAIKGAVEPLYRKLVLEAKPIDQSIGISIVHLLWLEIFDQLELGRDSTSARPTIEPDERAKLIERHLRTVGAKLKAHNLLLRVKQLRRQLDPFRDEI